MYSNINKGRCFARSFSQSILRKKETHYDVLKIPHDASVTEIKNKFKKISLKLHPDMLKSQGLTDEELSSKSDEYLKVKKSYEVLSDEKKKDAYDLHMGIRRREGTSTDNFFKRPGSTFHFHEKYTYNDIPHFDKMKHEARNERIEKRYLYNQKINQNIDTFGRDLYARNLGAEGPRKGIYKEYKYQPNIRDDENEGKKLATKLVGGVIGLFLAWYIICGNYSTKTGTEKKVEEVKKEDGPKTTNEPKEPIIKEEKNSFSRSGKKMSVNNNYGLMLIKEDIAKRDIMEEFEEQVAESVE